MGAHSDPTPWGLYPSGFGHLFSARFGVGCLVHGRGGSTGVGQWIGSCSNTCSPGCACTSTLPGILRVLLVRPSNLQGSRDGRGG